MRQGALSKPVVQWWLSLNSSRRGGSDGGRRRDVTGVTAARERRVSLGARHGPAPHSRKDEQRRRATAAWAVTATSAQKVNVLSGCGAVLSVAEHAG